MERINRRNVIGMLGIAPLAAGSIAGASTGNSKPEGSSSREMTRDRYFPNVVLTTHEGKKVRFYDDLIKDKIVVINMMYADCEGVCPGITANLVKVQKALENRIGRDIFMYSITLKPEQDSPRALKEYAKMHGVKPGWSFLTGDPKDIETLRRKLGFTNPDKELDRISHNISVWCVTGTKRSPDGPPVRAWPTQAGSSSRSCLWTGRKPQTLTAKTPLDRARKEQRNEEKLSNRELVCRSGPGDRCTTGQRSVDDFADQFLCCGRWPRSGGV